MGLQPPKSLKLVIFGINLPKSDFYKIWLGGESPRFAPSCQILSLWVKNVKVQHPKSPKLVFFCINLPKRGIPPSANFYKNWLGDGLPGSHPHAKFYRSGLINVGLWPKTSPKMVIFGINFSQRGISPEVIFYKILPGGGSPRTAPSCQILPL